MTYLVVLLLTVLLPAGAANADSWTQFRGPNGQGRSDAKGLPLTWSEKENVVWKTPIHDKGWSSPVVWGDQVWLTTAREDGKEMFAVCVDRTTGRIVHDLKLFDVEKPAFCIAYNSYASPTPVIEEGRIYIHFGTYGTVCLDTATGKTLWQQCDLHCDHFRGPGSSPVLFGGLLFLQFDGFDAQFVAALDKKSGAVVWKQPRNIDYGTTNGDYKKAFGTASIVMVQGKPQLVSSAAVATIAYDPATGEELWKVYHGGMNTAQPPQLADGRVILCTGDGGFRTLAVRPDGKGDVTSTHVDWKSNKGASSRTSPLYLDGRLYVIGEKGVLTCLDSRDGSVLWQERPGGNFCASPTYADGKLYLFGEDGKSVVGKPGAAWKELAVNKLDEGCMATPAISGKALFVRTKTHLYRIEKREEKQEE